jgi:hypothetical protein
VRQCRRRVYRACNWRADASRGCEGWRKTGLVVAAKKGPRAAAGFVHLCARFSCTLYLSIYISPPLLFVCVFAQWAQRAPAALQIWRALENKTKTAARQIMHTGRACVYDRYAFTNECVLWKGKLHWEAAALWSIWHALHIHSLWMRHISCIIDASAMLPARHYSGLVCVCVPCRKVICIFSHSSVWST